jgi:hypothetical protein
MGPSKKPEKERRQLATPTMFQRVLDALVVSSIVGGVAFGVSTHNRSLDNSHKIDRVEADVERVEDDQKELKKIVYKRFREYEDRFQVNEKDIDRLKQWQNRESR